MKHQVPTKIIPCDELNDDTYEGLTLILDREDGTVLISQDDNLVEITNTQAWALCQALGQSLMTDSHWNGTALPKPRLVHSKDQDN